jgi:hypothetical protein
MRKLVVCFMIVFVAGIGAFGLIRVARGQGSAHPGVLKSEAQGENLREIEGAVAAEDPQAPTIGFIDSPSATCYQPDAARDECLINWYYLSVSASPNYMITMTVALNSVGRIAHTQGFFQTSMYVPYNMLGRGFKVACGAPGGGGNPNLGNAYAYTIRARDSAGLKSANYGTTYCPAFQP